MIAGAIRCEQAYALGKMLDHSSWQRGDKIVRLSTPSDIDACWDNRGRVIFGEFSSECFEWRQVEKGQIGLYQSVIRDTPHCAVLCRHNVSVRDNRPIDSKEDVRSFQVMVYDYGFLVTDVLPESRWPRFVTSWFKDPLKVRRYVLKNVDAIHEVTWP